MQNFEVELKSTEIWKTVKWFVIGKKITELLIVAIFEK